MPDLLKIIFGWPITKYNELSTFISALICAFLFLSYPDFRQFLSNTFAGTLADGHIAQKLYIVGLILLVLYGFYLSIIHVFTNREKTPFEKSCMGVFAIGANAIAGLEGGLDSLNSGGSITVIFPIWNIVISFILLYKLRLVKFEITDENSSPMEISVASITLLIVFVITRLAFNLTWAIAFSTCMFFVSMVFFLMTLVTKRIKMQTHSK